MYQHSVNPTLTSLGILTDLACALVKSFGFPTLKANALSSVSGWLGLVWTICFGIASDRLKLRGPLVITAVGLFWVFWVACEWGDSVVRCPRHQPVADSSVSQSNRNPSRPINGRSTLFWFWL